MYCRFICTNLAARCVRTCTRKRHTTATLWYIFRLGDGAEALPAADSARRRKRKPQATRWRSKPPQLRRLLSWLAEAACQQRRFWSLLASKVTGNACKRRMVVRPKPLRIISSCCICQQNFHQLAVAFNRADFCRHLAAVGIGACNRHFTGFQLQLACTC